MQRVGLNLKLSKNSQENTNFSILNILFFGTPLGISNPETNLDGTVLYSDISIYLDCNKNSFHQSLPDIGYLKWKDFQHPEKMAKKLLAPLKLQIPLKKCKIEDITQIKLTFTENHSRHGQKKESLVWSLY